jgi:hypothetical protein
MPPKSYEIRIVGALQDDVVDAFAGCEVVYDGGVTMVFAQLDTAGLHGLLNQIRRLDLELLDVRQIRQPR